MSSALPTIDTTAFVVGTVGSINLNNSQTNWTPSGYSGQPAHIRIFNDSGVSLKIWTDTNVINEYLAAGGWGTWEIDPGTNAMNYEVVAVLANPPVNLIMPIFYQPGEKVPDTPILGNSPIGGGAVTSGSTLSNESNSTPTQIVDIGQVGNTFLISILSDGSFVWSVLQGGVAHQILKGQTAGNPLQLGKAADSVEVLGNVIIDGSLTSDATKITSDGAGNLTAVQYNSPATANAVLNAGAGQQVQLWIGGVGQLTVTTANIHADGHGIVCANIQPTAGQLNRIKFGHVSAISGQTVSHGMGTTPSAVFITTDIAQPGSATVGAGSVGSTTFVATVGAGSGFWWLAVQ